MTGNICPDSLCLAKLRVFHRLCTAIRIFACLNLCYHCLFLYDDENIITVGRDSGSARRTGSSLRPLGRCHPARSSNFLIANLELELSLSHSESAFYKFLIANILRFSRRRGYRAFFLLSLCHSGSGLLLEEADEVGEAEDLAFSLKQGGIGDLGLAESGGDFGNVRSVDIAFLRTELEILGSRGMCWSIAVD